MAEQHVESPGAEATAKTVDAAVATAAAKLGLRVDQVHVEVLQEPEPSRFGHIGRVAKVRVHPREAARPATAVGTTPAEAGRSPVIRTANHGPNASSEPDGGPPSGAEPEGAEPEGAEPDGAEPDGAEPDGAAIEAPDEDDAGLAEADVELAADFIEGLLDVLDVDADITTWTDPAGGHVDVTGADLGALIGRGGDTLTALQDLMRIAVSKHGHHRPRVALDVGGYRAAQRQQLEADALAVAQRVVATGQPERMRPMAAYERKVVHDTVIQVAGARTVSEGEEPNRRVVVEPVR